jgi:hypothetical protein
MKKNPRAEYVRPRDRARARPRERRNGEIQPYDTLTSEDVAVAIDAGQGDKDVVPVVTVHTLGESGERRVVPQWSPPRLLNGRDRS